MIGLSFVGLALFAYFQHHPLPAEFETDKLLPYFMSLAFPAGAVGLVIAAIMAASLSSIDSAINSCSSVAVVDLYNRLWQGARGASAASTRRRRSRTGAGAVDIATVFFGALGTIAGAATCRGIGSLLEINNKVVNAFTGPLFGIFLLAMFSRATPAATPCSPAAWPARSTAYYVAYHSGIGFHVAVDVRPGGDARRSGWLLALVLPWRRTISPAARSPGAP